MRRRNVRRARGRVAVVPCHAAEPSVARAADSRGATAQISPARRSRRGWRRSDRLRCGRRWRRRGVARLFVEPTTAAPRALHHILPCQRGARARSSGSWALTTFLELRDNVDRCRFVGLSIFHAEGGSSKTLQTFSGRHEAAACRHRHAHRHSWACWSRETSAAHADAVHCARGSSPRTAGGALPRSVSGLPVENSLGKLPSTTLST